MIILISILAILIIYIIFFQYKKWLKFPTLRAIISIDDEDNYVIKYEVLRPELLEAESTKLVLHFISKILNVCSNKKELQSINIFLKLIEKEGIETALNEINIIASEGTLSSSKKITATLRYVNILRRGILCKIPNIYYADNGLLFNSMFSLLKVTYHKLSQDQKEILEDSIKYMARKYEAGINPKSFKTMISLPNEAFLESF